MRKKWCGKKWREKKKYVKHGFNLKQKLSCVCVCVCERERERERERVRECVSERE